MLFSSGNKQQNIQMQISSTQLMKTFLLKAILFSSGNKQQNIQMQISSTQLMKTFLLKAMLFSSSNKRLNKEAYYCGADPLQLAM